MKTILSSRRHHYCERLAILLLVVALMMGTTGCSCTVDYGPIAETKITNWKGLNDIRYNPEGSYVLMNNLDKATEGYADFVGDTWDRKGWQPIGTEGEAFKGTFNGNGHNISDLFIDRPNEEYVGLFGRVQVGLIKNVGLVSANVTGNKSVGALVGYSWKGTLESDTRSPSMTYSNGSVTGEKDVGGLVGCNYEGTVDSCESSADVFHVSSASDEIRLHAGGLVGLNAGTVLHCDYNGAVNGDREVGGLVGHNQVILGLVQDCGGVYRVDGKLDVGGVAGRNWGTLRRSSFTGEVKGIMIGDGLIALNEGATGNADSSDTAPTGSYVGGVVGVNEGTVEDCSAEAMVEGYQYVGGLAGANNGTVEGSSAKATVEGYQYVGGLVGANAGKVGSCTSSGNVTGNSDAGQLVGYNMVTGTVSNSDSTSCVIGAPRCGDLVGRDEAEPWDYTITLDFKGPHGFSIPLWGHVYEPWIGEVQTASGPDGGKFVFDVTSGSEPWHELETISTGAFDLGQVSGDTFHLGSIGDLPFFFRDTASCAYATFNLFNTAVGTWDALGELDDVKVLLSSPLPPVQWWGNVDVKTLADMSGLLIRAEAMEVPTIQALGAIPVTGIDIADLYSALDTGLIDGCFVTYDGGESMLGLKDVCSYVTEVNLFPGIYVLAMNKAVYDGLPSDARALLDSFCTAEKSVELAAALEAAEGDAKDYIQFGPPPQLPIYVLPQAEVDNWRAACASVYTDWVDYMDALGFDGQGIYDRALELVAAAP